MPSCVEPLTGQNGPPVLTIGTYGLGQVILTTWRAYDVYAGAQDPQTTFSQGSMLLNNLLMQGYQDLFLDYGAQLPPDTNVIPSIREMQITDPDFSQPIQISLVTYVFP